VSEPAAKTPGAGIASPTPAAATALPNSRRDTEPVVCAAMTTSSSADSLGAPSPAVKATADDHRRPTPKGGPAARGGLTDFGLVLFSAASLWEIVIKASLYKADFNVDVAVLRPALAGMGFAELPVSGAHAERLARLPPLHKDPFDRMLVAQSLAEPLLLLLTNDGALADYGESVKLV
jgi:PIN domain nuclease of toxin-antitoxin system